MTNESNILGSVVSTPLTRVKPNDWNPNTMTARQYESLKRTLELEGWYASQALLVWGTDDQGEKRDIIIDGEHRWKAAGELGYKKVPMVLLHGLPEAEAKALTIKLDAKRGTFDANALAALVSRLNTTLESDDLALDLGVTDEEFNKMLSSQEQVFTDTSPAPELPTSGSTKSVSENSTARMVPLYMSQERYDQFAKEASVLTERYGSSSVSDAIIAAVAEARSNGEDS